MIPIVINIISVSPNGIFSAEKTLKKDYKISLKTAGILVNFVVIGFIIKQLKWFKSLWKVLIFQRLFIKHLSNHILFKVWLIFI